MRALLANLTVVQDDDAVCILDRRKPVSDDDLVAALETTGAKSELLAAGYNSNAAKLPLYLKRGGDSWRTLIPRETQMYLQIYKSFEGLVPIQSRAADDADKGGSRSQL